MSELGIERRKLRLAWWPPALASLVLLLVIGVLFARALTRSAPANTLNINSVEEVLAHATLPRTFTYSGLNWMAVESGRFPKRELIPVGPLVDGHPIYYQQGTSTRPYETLYMRAAQTGPYADVFVRYNPSFM